MAWGQYHNVPRIDISEHSVSERKNYNSHSYTTSSTKMLKKMLNYRKKFIEQCGKELAPSNQCSMNTDL